MEHNLDDVMMSERENLLLSIQYYDPENASRRQNFLLELLLFDESFSRVIRMSPTYDQVLSRGNDRTRHQGTIAATIDSPNAISHTEHILA